MANQSHPRWKSFLKCLGLGETQETMQYVDPAWSKKIHEEVAISHRQSAVLGAGVILVQTGSAVGALLTLPEVGAVFGAGMAVLAAATGMKIRHEISEAKYHQKIANTALRP